MTELENKLKTILTEKNKKIVPENIREGVTIFNVKGGYKGEPVLEESTINKIQFILKGNLEQDENNKITTVGQNVNKFNKNDSTMYVKNLYIDGMGSCSAFYNQGYYSVCYPCKPSTTYYISKTSSYALRLGDLNTTPFTDSYSYHMVSGFQNYNGTENTTSAKITTSSDAKYLIVCYYVPGTGYDTLSESTIRASIKITEEVETGSYSNYGLGCVTVTVSSDDDTTIKKYIIPTQKEFVKIGEEADTFEKINGIWYEKHYYNKIDSYNGELIETEYVSSTGNLSTGATIYYLLGEPELIECTEEQSNILESGINLNWNISKITSDGISQLSIIYTGAEINEELEIKNAGLRNEVSLLQNYSESEKGKELEINDCVGTICELYVFGETTQEENPTYTDPKTVQNVGTNGNVIIKVDNGLEETDKNYQSYTRSLPIQEELCKIGNREDYFERDNGIWYEVHNHSQYTLTGGFTVAKGSIFLLTDTIMDNLLGDSDYGYCSHFFVDKDWIPNYTSWQNLGNNVMVCGRSYFHQILVRCDGYTTADAFNDMLAEKQPKLYYPSLNTRKLPCTEEQIEVLNSFYTFGEKTRVFIEGLGQIKLKYRKPRADDEDTILGSYVDTRDATATAADIAKDKTAYVNGEKITGELEVENQEYTIKMKINGSNSLRGLFQQIGSTFIEGSSIEGEIDFTGITLAYDMFYDCSYLTNIENLKFKNSQNLTNITRIFYNCAYITSTPDIDCSNVISVYNSFNGCVRLAKMGLLTNLGKAYTQQTEYYGNYTLALPNSGSLTTESLINVFDSLYDLNLTYDVANGGTLYRQKITLLTVTLTALQATEEGLQAIERVQAKGWDLVTH